MFFESKNQALRIDTRGKGKYLIISDYKSNKL